MTDLSQDLLMERASQPLRKSYQRTLDDFVQTQVMLHFQRVGRRGPLRVGLVFWSIMTLLNYLVQGPVEYPLLVAAIVAAPIAFVMYAISRWLPPFNFRRMLKYFYGSGPYSIQVELGESQFIYVSDDYEQRFRWPAVSRLVSTPDDLHLYISTYGLFRIPTSVFSSDDEKRQWMTTIEQKTGLSFS